MTRILRTTLVLSLLLGPAAALAQAAADAKAADAPAQPGPADAARPLDTTPPAPTEAPRAEVKPAAPAAAPTLASVLTRFELTLYGYVNFDALYDSTRTHDEGMGVNGVARQGTQAGDHGRWVFTARNSRFGFRMAAPEYDHVKVSALLETDFGRYWTSGGGYSEGNYYDTGLLRLRQAHFKLETPWVDVLLGQTTHLFGWQSSFFPATAAMLGIPGEPFGRSPQLRVTKLLKTRAVNVETAVAAMRPPQRDTDVPQLQGGVRFLLNDYKGTHSLGAGGTNAYPAALGISGAYRQFRAGGPVATTATTWPEKTVDGYGVSFDALLPILPARGGQRANSLTLVGTYAITRAAGDLLGGVSGLAPGLSGATTTHDNASPAAPTGEAYKAPDVNTIVFDDTGKPHGVNWNGMVVGLDYYLPPSGRVFVSTNYSLEWSDNVTKYMPAANAGRVFWRGQYWDANLFFDVTPAARLVLSWQHRDTKYADGLVSKNERYHFSAYYFF